MSLGEELQQAAARISGSVGAGVVRIGRNGRGSGLVIANGSVLTSAHNLRGAETTVIFRDGRRETGSLAAADPDADLAVLRSETGETAPIGWAVSASEAIALGAPVVAVAARGEGGNRVTFGTVSALGRAFRGPRGRLISDGIEHTAPLARGSSGGPLLDLSGNLVGINTHRTGDGLYLAVPAGTELVARVDALVRGESPQRLRLGVGLAPPAVAARLRESVGLPPREGVLVREVAQGSPAERAGLQRGDLIVAAGSRPVQSVDSLLSTLDAVDAGDAGDARLALTVVRGVEEVELEVRFPPD